MKTNLIYKRHRKVKSLVVLIRNLNLQILYLLKITCNIYTDLNMDGVAQ